MYCSECGSKNKEKAKFCVKCGAMIQSEIVDDTRENIEEQESARLEKQEKLKKEKEQQQFNQGLLGCLGVIGLIIIIWLIFGWFCDSDKDEVRDVPITRDQEHIVITDDSVNIRTEPNGTIIVQARSGDIFEIRGSDGDWFVIHMFSGEYRYVHSSLARRSGSPPWQPDEATRRRAFQALVNAEDRAIAEADRRIPPVNAEDINRNINLQRLLDDRYKLEVCHQYGLHPAHYNAIKLEGIRKGWLR